MHSIHQSPVPAIPLPADGDAGARDADFEDLEALRAGNDAALNAIISRWKKPLHAFAWRYLHDTGDADDLVAETFVRLHRVRLKLRPDTRLRAWLFTTLANLCHNRHRWRRRHPTISLDGPTGTGLPGPLVAFDTGQSPDSALEESEEDALLMAAIDSLPHDQRTAILLHHFERMSYREIGRITGCTERGVETRLYRARRRLREALRIPE